MADVKVNEQQLDGQLSRLEQARLWSPRVMSKLETFIRSAPDFDLFRVNPVQYALERSMTEAEALDLFLHAAKVGLFEMDWHIVCPHCGFIIDSLHTMSQLRTHYLCPSVGLNAIMRWTIISRSPFRFHRRCVTSNTIIRNR